MSMDFDFEGRTALVTGSTRGIGRATAEAFLEAGARVLVNGPDGEEVREVVGDLGGPGEARAAPGDVATAEGVEGILEVAEEAGPVDVLVNNAGVFERGGLDAPDEDWSRHFQVNVMGAVRLSRGLLPGMLDRGWGRVVNVASDTALRPIPSLLHYSTTKTALLGLSRGLAELTRGTGVTVNSLLPGPTETEGHDAFLEEVAEARGVPAEDLREGYVEEAAPTSLLERLEEPGEVAEVVLFLASDEAEVVNGTSLLAEGGLVRDVL